MRTSLTLLTVAMAALVSGCNGTNTNAGNAPAANAPMDHSGMDHSGMEHSSMPSMARLQGLNGAEFDTAFASQMIEHHQGAVDMSEETLKHAKRDEVKAAARKIFEDQKKEIAQMKAWVKEWSGNEPASEDRELMKADMQPMMSAFKADCGTDCDRAFLTHMKAHHQMAVDMAKLAAEKAEHPELKELAGKIVEAQEKEIKQFDRWQTEWYP